MKRRIALALMVGALVAGCTPTTPTATVAPSPWTYNVTGVLLGVIGARDGAGCSLDVAGNTAYDGGSAIAARQQDVEYPGVVTSVAVETITDYGLAGEYCVLRFSIPNVTAVSNKSIYITVSGSIIASFSGFDYPSGSSLEAVNGINEIGVLGDGAVNRQ